VCIEGNRLGNLLNFETSIIGREIARLTRQSTDAACANQEAAQLMGRTTRVSFEVSLQLRSYTLGTLTYAGLSFYYAYHHSTPVFQR
jgi:hypothetical protein